MEPKYRDREIFDLVMFGDGRAAKENPEVVKALFGDTGPKVTVPAETQTVVWDQVSKADPLFNERVAAPMQSGSPMLVEQASKNFSTDISAARSASYSTAAANGDGQGVAKNDVALYNQVSLAVKYGVAEAVWAVTTLAQTAEVALWAVVVVAVVPILLTWNFDMNKVQDVDRRDTVLKVAAGLK